MYLLFVDFPKACLSVMEGFETKNILNPSETHRKEGLYHDENKISLNGCKIKKG